MSHTHRHYHAKLRWLQTRKSGGWSRPAPRRAQYSAEVADGTAEFQDTCHYYDASLDYVTHAYLHTWRAAEDRRHRGRRAIDRTRSLVRPSRVSRFMEAWLNLMKNLLNEAAPHG